MPGKRISLAAGLETHGLQQKAARPNAGPLVACMKSWGSADWVFEGVSSDVRVNLKSGVRKTDLHVLHMNP